MEKNTVTSPVVLYGISLNVVQPGTGFLSIL